MIPFKLPRWRKKQINNKYARKAKVINRAVIDMETVMFKAIDFIMDHYGLTGQFMVPSLNAMYTISDQFYRNVITQAFYSSQDEKNLQKNKKKLAKGPPKLPSDLTNLEKIFRDRRAWPKIMKRSEKLVDRLRKQYLEKLRRKFKQLLPKLQAGEMSPAEAKTQMRKAWGASKNRVETIFRTETTNYFGQVSVSFFEKDPEIIGFLFDSIRDTSRTDICRSRHGLIFKPDTTELRENMPALHFNCRSHLIALANTPYNRKLMEEPRRDPKRATLAPLPSGWRK